MADEGDILTDLNLDPGAAGHGGNGADNQPAAGIVSQYVKDLSVENPNAPDSYQWEGAPNIDLQFNIGATPVSGEIHEVELKIVLTAKVDKGTLYLIELSYCGLVGMRNLPDEHAHAFLYAEAPRMLFPFARRIVADASRDLGYQPLMLEPIDFNGLYMQQLERRAQEQAGEAPAGQA
ncbi:MAG: protein-export chaperone SecB [Tsuneonella sp.]